MLGRARGACSPGGAASGDPGGAGPVNPTRPGSAVTRAPWEETDYTKVKGLG